jgi:UDP-N-acetylglucosamine--N-acetylmuramyl-(pentapeptide) pyrophosphoryl-undecaprenol N-acetylglucosamine transferase
MEMEKVPSAGYEIVGLPILGLQRQLNWNNVKNDVKVPFKLVQSVRKAGKLIDTFKPEVAIGVGGYASAPLLWVATRKGVPALIQEQNGFAGLTNKILAKKAGSICVAYDGMEKFFPADRIVFTGNPIRKEIFPVTPEMKEEGIRFYGLDPDKKHILIVGGSLGSRTLNEAMKKWISDGCPGGEDVEVLWQCGKYYKSSVDAFMEKARGKDPLAGIHHSDFIKRMDLAYAAADVVVSRSGASSVSELCAARKASILVPSPNVAEDHQTHNAMALVRKDAAILVKDSEAAEKMMAEAVALAADPARIKAMETNIAPLARMDAAMDIAKEVYRLLEK